MPDLTPGSLFDERYELIERVGAGGFGTVWRARDIATSDTRALKILHADIDSQDTLNRFRNEAAILTELTHPNIVRGYGFVARPESPYMVSEFLVGSELTLSIAGASAQNTFLPLHFVQSVFTQLCEGVAAAHAHDVLHRDLKPPNILLLDDGTVKVLDFGIAKLLAADALDATTLGRRLGSYCYMSPEQVLGHAPGPESDVFALGCILFEMLTARRPWLQSSDGSPAPAFSKPPPQIPVNSIAEVLRRIARGEHPTLSDWRPGLPKSIDELMTKALAAKRQDRFQSPDELKSALQRQLGSAAAILFPSPQQDPDASPQGKSAALPLLVAAPVSPTLETPTSPTIAWPDPTPEPSDLTPVLLPTMPLVPTPPPRPRPRRALVPALLVLCLLAGVAGLWWTARPKPPRAAPPVSMPEVPAPGAVATPVAEAPPVIIEASAPKKQVRRRKVVTRKASPKKTTKASPKTKPKPLARAQRLLRRLKADPSNAELAGQLKSEIVRQASVLDAPTRRRITRMAETSARMGDVQGMQDSLTSLEASVR